MMKKVKDTKNVAQQQIVTEKNKIQSISLSVIPKLICTSMIAIVLIQAIAVLTVVVLGIVNEIPIDNAVDMTRSLIGENLLTIGIAILAMVASVWVGLNIYLSITKEEYETLSKKISEMSIKYEEEKQEFEVIKTTYKKEKEELNNEREMTAKSFLQAQKDTFIWKMDSQRFKYSLAGFLAWLFERENNTISAEEYQKLYELEVQYINTTEYYEQNRWQEAFVSARKLSMEYKAWSRFEDRETLLSYAKIRIADLLFYCFTCQARSQKVPKEITISQMEKTIRDYKDFIQKYEDQIMDYEIERFGSEMGETAAYIYNTIGYSYDLINQIDGTNEIRKVLAVENMEKAVTYLESENSKKKARYLRNLGLTYQRQHDWERALDRYEESLKNDETDYKSSVNVASIILLQVEKDIKLSDREKVYLDIDMSAIAGYKDELLKAERMCLMAISNSVSFEDSYYKLAQTYIYFYFVENDYRYLDKAEEKLMQLEICSKKPKGYLFTKRNWYEAKGDYQNALNISRELPVTPDNDVVHMIKLYEGKLGDREQKD